MLLTRAQFDIACKGLVAAKRQQSPAADALEGWSWTDHSSIPHLGFLSRTVYHFRRSQPSCIDPLPPFLDLEQNVVEKEDDAAATVEHESIVCRQYIVYSATFQVPAFYFTLHDTKGMPLNLMDLVRTTLFHPFAFENTSLSSFGLTRPSSSFPLLSQGDHPVLGTPCWYLHPCETAKSVDELISELNLQGSAEDLRLIRWVETWFVVLGTAVNTRS